MIEFYKRDEVLDQCSKIEERYRRIKEGDYHVLIKKMAESMYNRSNEIKNICQTDQYDLYFSGKVGIGKSTLICMLLGLINNEKLIEGERLSDALLLKTGSGRTTICETQIILHANETRFTVEEVSSEEFYAYLKEFSDYIIDQPTSSIAEEYVRFIKNMVNIPQKDDASIFDILSINVSDDYDDKKKAEIIFDTLSNICNYEERTKKVFLFSNTATDFKTWCKETFSAINDGEISLAPMPKKIILEISDDDFKCEVPYYVHSIVDTRGLEGGERPDIQNYISRQNSITMMCDNIKSYGSEEAVLSILKQLLIPEDKDKRYRVLLLGMEKGYELEDIEGFEEDREAGKRKKIKEAKRVIDQSRISFCDNNYIFANTAPSIEILKRQISSVSIKKIQDAQREFWSDINNKLNYMWSQYYTEMNNSLDILERFSRKEINPDTMGKINRCLQNAKRSCEQLENNINNVLQNVSIAIKNNTLAASLRGAVNHFGIGNTADVYGIFQKCCSFEFNEQCRELKNHIIRENCIFFDSPSELEKICLNFMNDQIDALYQKYYTEYRNYIYSSMYDNLYNSQSWLKAQGFWGDGQGSYRNRVWDSIYEQIKSHNLEQILTNQEYMAKFADNVISFLTI